MVSTDGGAVPRQVAREERCLFRMSKTPPSTFRLGHKWTMAPALEHLCSCRSALLHTSFRLSSRWGHRCSMNSKAIVRCFAPSPVFKPHRPSVMPRDIGDESNPTILITPETRHMFCMEAHSMQRFSLSRAFQTWILTYRTNSVSSCRTK